MKTTSKKRIAFYARQMERINNTRALGYECTLDFNLGFLSCLLSNEWITRKEYEVLKKVYANWNNANCIFFIDKEGNLCQDREAKEGG